jgi:hypothetical protein
MSPPSGASGAFDVVRLLDALADVHYVVVGGVAAALHGSPRLTMDLDIVPDPAVDNVDRLADALAGLAATIREPGGRRLPVDGALLHDSARAPRGGQLRLRTRYGPLDLLWRLHDGRGYAEIAPHTVVLSDAERAVRVVDVDTLIDIKRGAGRVRDRDDVAILERIRDRGR